MDSIPWVLLQADVLDILLLAIVLQLGVGKPLAHQAVGDTGVGEGGGSYHGVLREEAHKYTRRWAGTGTRRIREGGGATMRGAGGDASIGSTTAEEMRE